MLLLLSKRKPCSAFLPLLPLPFACRCSSSAPQNPDPKSSNFIISDYLITSFGFPADKAAKVSKPLSHLKSPRNPDSVRRFLQQEGFSSENDIIKLITRCPRILCSSPDKTLSPNLTALRDIGLSTTALTHLIPSTPAAIMFRSAALTIKFWLDFFGGNEEALVTAFRRNVGMASHDIGRMVTPNISILRSHGLSTNDIQSLVLQCPRLITAGVGVLDNTLNRAEELGFRPGSNKFVQGLHAVHVNSRDMLRKKKELFERFNWSEDEFFAALQKGPLCATLSENVRVASRG